MSFSDAPIRYRISPSADVLTIPRSQRAALLRALWHHRHEEVTWDTLYQAINRSPEVQSRIHDLRHKHLIPIACRKVDNKGGRGKHGLYRLDPCVVVIEGDA